MADSCPTPVKKKRTDNSVESSDSEDLNLSSSFDEDYQILMNEEILKICKHPSLLMENFEINDLLPDFINRCDDLLEWIKKASLKSPFKSYCRCDSFLDKHEKISCIKRLFESPHFANINSIANLMMSNKPYLAGDIQRKLDELQSIWKSKYLTFDIDFSAIASDINKDINDLRIWVKETKEKLSVQIAEHVEYNSESIEKILTDFKVHDDISNSITKTIDKAIQMNSLMEFKETLSKCKLVLDELISQIHGQWLKAMELKYKLEFMSNGPLSCNPYKNFGISLLGQESGFESEMSPMNPIRGFPNSNLYMMRYISSSGECFADNQTTDMPMDSDSTEQPLDFSIKKSISSSSSFIETMLELPRHFSVPKDEIQVRKKIKRLRKKRNFPHKSIESCSDNLTIEEKEDYLQNRSAFHRQTSSLKRRISETSTIEPFDQTDLSTKISDLAATAEKIVMRNDLSRRKNSSSGSPKESELDDHCGILVVQDNELNVKEVWDNYQASLYSNDDDDSQILEVDKIKDWEQDIDTDDQHYESCYKDKTLQLLTSGYETSLESDMHFCEKNLINVLQFSESQQFEVNEQIEIIGQNLEIKNPERIIKINEQLSISNTHVKLLNRILNSDGCDRNRNEALTNEIILLKDTWENLIKKLINIQLKQERIINSSTLDLIIENINNIDSKIVDLKLGNGLPSLKSTIDVLNGHKTELLSVNGQIIKVHSDGRYVMEEDIKSISCRIDSMIERICSILKSLNNDYEIMKMCSENLADCQDIRKEIELELKLFTLNEKARDWKILSNNMLRALDTCKGKLKRSMSYLSNISTEMCYESMRLSLDEELKSVDDLVLQLRLALPVIDKIRSKMDSGNNNSVSKSSTISTGRLLNRLPVQVAIVVIIAICGWWYHHQSSYSCPDSSDWFRIIRKYTSKFEPH